MRHIVDAVHTSLLLLHPEWGTEWDTDFDKGVATRKCYKGFIRNFNSDTLCLSHPLFLFFDAVNEMKNGSDRLRSLAPLKIKTMKKIDKHGNAPNFIEEIADQYWLPQDDELILEELIIEERVASVQLLVKYMPELLKIAQELYPVCKDKEKIMAEVIRCFLEKLSFSYVDYCHQKNDEPYSVINYLNTVKMEMLGQLRGDDEKMKPHHFNHTQLAKLNKLNEVLKKRQVELWSFIEEQISYLEKLLNQENKSLSGWELKLEIQFYIMKSSQPVHNMSLKVNRMTREKLSEQMNNSVFDWWTKGMPVLEEPCSYLLGQLFEQWQIVHRIPDIVMVWSNIQVEYQSSVLFKDKKWILITKKDSILKQPKRNTRKLSLVESVLLFAKDIVSP